jgi:hypothetical protein
MATAAVGAGISVAKLAITALAAHTARLKDAQQENEAMAALIPAWDADIQAIVAAYNSGDYTASACIAAAQAVDTQSFNYLRGLVGKAGTAWGGPTTSSIGYGNRPIYSATCNKSCTAACCVYLNDLRPGIYGRGGLGSAYQPWQTSSGSVTGLIELLQSGSGVLKIITIAAPASKYGDFSRTGYTLTLTKPSAVHEVQGTLAKTIASMTGSNTASSNTSTSESSADATVASILSGGGGSSGAVAAAAASQSSLALPSSGNNTLILIGAAMLGFFALLLVALKR